MDKVLVLDFGGQYNQLIARRVRNFSVFAEIKPYNKITVDEIKNIGYKGIIFTGGPNSVYDEKSPHYDKEILNIGIPILGICYGCQLMAYMASGTIESAENSSEYGRTNLYIDVYDKLFDGVKKESICWMSHNDYVSKVPNDFIVTATTDKCKTAAMSCEEKKLYAVQFHPEVLHTECGKTILSNFIFNVCDCKKDWQIHDFIDRQVTKYRNELKDKKVLLALSGGVDSTVVAVLLNKAIGKNLTCVFVDHGLLRKNERESVEKNIRDAFDINLIVVDAKDRFLSKLSGVVEPEKKRKIIGEEFIRVFEDEAKKLGKVEVLAQGTIYPDVVESGRGDSATIKSHHNVGGLPKDIGFTEIVEPLRELFKDEVRAVGEKLGIKKSLVYRQPFPGPGLAVRVIGEITEEKLNIVRLADDIFCKAIEESDFENKPNQYFAAITNVKSVGVMGDARTYGYTVVLRAVNTDDFMTATWTHIPYELMDIVSNKIVNEVKGVTRVVYDMTSKPPATIEWE